MLEAPSSLPEFDCHYSICSDERSDVTADNLPGHGRLLGNVYSYLGGKLEPILARAVRGMGCGPQAVAEKVQRFSIEDDDWHIKRDKRKKAEKKCKQLARYVK